MRYGVLFSGYIALTIGAAAMGAEVAVSDRGEPAPAAPLPRCVSDPVAVDLIKQSIAANKGKSPKLYLKYLGYERELTAETDVEKVARLVYAEATAANCGPKTAELTPVIADVIANRVRKRDHVVRRVIFEPDQFASSLNNYDESHYRDFLCPRDPKLFARARDEARRALSGQIDLPPDVVHYFLYKHSPRWTKPPWTLPEFTIGESLRPCLRAFPNPKWH